MNKIKMALMTIMVVSMVETAFAGEAATIKNDSMMNPDSVINYLDPSNAPGARITTTGAKSVMRENPDSVINYLSPSSAPVARIATTGAKLVMREKSDSVINYLDPSNAPVVRR